MTSSAVNIYFTSAHPWSAAIRALSELSMHAFVIQIQDEETSLAKLRFAKARFGDKAQQMNVVSLVAELCASTSVIDATPAFLQAIDTRSLHSATNALIQDIKDMSVSDGLDVLNGLLLEPLSDDERRRTRIGLPHCALTIRARHSGPTGIQVLVTAQANSEISTSITKNMPTEMLDVAAEILVGVSLDGKITYLNRGATSLIGADALSRGSEIVRSLTPESAQKFAQIATLIARSQDAWNGCLEFIAIDGGKPVAANCQISLLHSGQDKSVTGYCIAGFRNVRQNPLDPQSESMTRQRDDAARLVLMGKLAQHTIQEIEAPLAVIRDKSDKINWLMQGAGARALGAELSGQLSDGVGKIMKMGQRIDSILNGMKNLARNDASEPMVDVNVPELLSEVHELVDGFAKKAGVHLEFNSAQLARRVPMQHLRVSQMIVNMVLNACDAVKALDEKWVRLNLVTDDEWIYLSVVDSGRGIPPALRTRLFDPFFTTKGPGRGSGIGLNLSRQIARDHGGDLYLDETSENTRFVLELPMTRIAPLKDSEEDWEEI